MPPMPYPCLILPAGTSCATPRRRGTRRFVASRTQVQAAILAAHVRSDVLLARWPQRSGVALRPAPASSALGISTMFILRLRSHPSALPPPVRERAEESEGTRHTLSAYGRRLADHWYFPGPARSRDTAPRRATRGRKTEAVLALDFLAY